jgi:hypothetical protein
MSCIRLLVMAFVLPVLGCSPPCGDGTVEADRECVAAYEEIDCGEGTVAENGICVPAYDEIDCGEGTVEDNGVCVPAYEEVECGLGTILVDGECVPESTTECGYGTVLVGEHCVPVDHVQVFLPFEEGYAVDVSQGHHGAFSHNGRSSYAVDFPLEEGTIVTAMKAGVVRDIKESSDTGCGTSDCSGDANYVVVDHGDGTRAYYYHLKLNGALVDEGDVVGAGQAVGLSGNTGWSTRPHLHIEIKDFVHNSLPLVFQDVAENHGILYPGGSYVSGNVETEPAEGLDYSFCAEDSFSYRGVSLDSEIPCSVAKSDQIYSLQGTAFTGGQVQVAQYSTLQGEWIYDCFDLDENGFFDTEISFDAKILGSSSYLMISPAAETQCLAYQSWVSSVSVKVR